MRIELSTASQAKLEDILEQLYTRYDLEDLAPEELIDALLDIGWTWWSANDHTIASRDRLVSLCGHKVATEASSLPIASHGNSSGAHCYSCVRSRTRGRTAARCTCRSVIGDAGHALAYRRTLTGACPILSGFVFARAVTFASDAQCAQRISSRW